MNTDMHVYIPSKGRADNVKTLTHIPQEWLAVTHLVVPVGESDAYYRNHGPYLVECPVEGIAVTRQWVLENTESPYLLMLDDDMDFSYRTADGKLLKAEHEQMDKMLTLLETWLAEGFIHVGVSQRAGNNRVEEPYVDVARMNNAYAFNAPRVLEAGARFDRLKVMEDFDLTLMLLRAGFPNRVTYEYCWGQGKSGAPGGCSSYRTASMQREAAFALAKLHPGLVRVHGKQAKQTWEGIGDIRTDVVIEWKRAYRPRRGTQQQSSGIDRFLKR